MFDEHEFAFAQSRQSGITGTHVPCAQTLMWSIIFVLVDAMITTGAHDGVLVPDPCLMVRSMSVREKCWIGLLFPR